MTVPELTGVPLGAEINPYVSTWDWDSFRSSSTPARPEALRIAWAPFAHEHAPSGYGVIARELRLALTRAGATILPTTAFGWDCVIAVSLPVAWTVGNSQHRPDLVYHTMYEMDRLPAEWPAVLNGCGLVWVPSAYCERIFRENGVTVPIMCSGYGVDEKVFHMGERALSIAPERPMRFIAWGPGYSGRKNLLMAARAFKCAHLPSGEAVLEIKVNENFGEPIFKDDDGNVIDNIAAVATNWPASTLADWLRTADVLIYPSGGEGFGLQPLEAMACGVLPICAYNTGMTDYLDKLPALRVPCPDRVLSPTYSTIWQQPLYQWQPDFNTLVDQIRWCFNHRAQVSVLGATCANEVRANWTWRQAGEKALRLLEAHFGGA